jgi:cytidylate kinase
MYRAVTLAAFERGIPYEDEGAVTLLAEGVDIDVTPPSKPDGRSYDVLLDGQDVTWEIRQPEVDAHVSMVSAYPGVRRALTIRQRRIGLPGRAVMAGRDIGTIVIPEADLKIYLDGSVEERARRRYLELRERGLEVEYDDILAGMRERDRIDSTRQIAPLQADEDAVVINTNGLSINQVLARVLELAEGEDV